MYTILARFVSSADVVGELPGHLPADEEAAGTRIFVCRGRTRNGGFHRRKSALGVARSVM